jgi:hypothetical protein
MHFSGKMCEDRRWVGRHCSKAERREFCTITPIAIVRGTWIRWFPRNEEILYATARSRVARFGRVLAWMRQKLAEMNIANAFGFFVIGTAMIVSPMLAPAGFPPTGFDGTSARALWLDVVGASQVLIGASGLIQIWINRVADSVATVRCPRLDRSPLPASFRATSATA